MAESEWRRPDPEQLLKQVEAAERHQRRGRLKVFLGYASGVGKSFRMCDEGRRRRARGQDVVVAAAQPETPHDVTEILRSFETIPFRADLPFPCVDVDAGAATPSGLLPDRRAGLQQSGREPES